MCARRFPLALGAVVLVAGCGGSSRSSTPSSAASEAAPSSLSPAAVAGSFGWLHTSAPTPGWPRATLAHGRASAAYPPAWAAIRTDPGTATTALLGPHKAIIGYLNLTPRQGGETMANWAAFRLRHNVEEGDRAVLKEASARGLVFPSGAKGSCVVDRYETAIARYREIACLAGAGRGTTVVVAAAPRGEWAAQASTLRREIASLRV